MKRWPLALIITGLLSTAPPLAAESWKDKVKDQSATKEEPAAPTKQGKKTFTPKERDEIEGYFKAHPEARKQLPPGLAKKKKLPPGWQKKLAPGQRVPDDVWERRVDLPKDIKTAEEKGTIRVRIDDRVLKVSEKTREVLDVLNLP